MTYANQTLGWQRWQLSQVNLEHLQDIPRNIKILILSHSQDKKQLFGGVLWRVKDNTKGKLSSDDFQINVTAYNVEYERLVKLLNQYQQLKPGSSEVCIAFTVKYACMF